MSNKTLRGGIGTKAPHLKLTEKNESPAVRGMQLIQDQRATAQAVREAAEAKAPQTAAQFRRLADEARKAGARSTDTRWEETAGEYDRQAAALEQVAKTSKAPTAKALRNEHEVYSPEGENASWCADLITVRNSAYNLSPRRDHVVEDAYRRLGHYGLQLRAHVMERDEIGERVLRSQAQRYASEGLLPYEVEHRMQEFRRNILDFETRDDSTGATSLGTFVIPSFFLSQFQIYRSAAAPLLAAAGKAPLPPYGLTVDVPVIGAPIGAIEQAGENTNVLGSAGSSAFSASYASAPLGSYVAAIIASQALLDRTGPGVTFDQVVAKQAAREIATQFETKVWAAIVAGAQNVSRNASATFNVADLWSDVANAIQLAVNAPGTNAHPTHTFGNVSTLTGFMQQVDSEGRPIWAPSSAQTSGGNDGTKEGFSGYDLLGTSVFYDENAGGPSAGYSNLVIGAPELALLVIESDPIVDVYPAADAATLSSFVGVRQYAASALLYPEAFVNLSGTFYTSTF
jgi:hypothetical protein